MIITDAKLTKRGRVSVYADGEFLFAVEKDSWVMSSLKIGQETDEEALNDLLRSSNTSEAKRRALNMLSARDYTAKTLTERIARKTDSQSAKEAVERMCELGLINDNDYSFRYATELLNSKGYAPRRIRFELKRRGICDNIIEETMEQLDFGDPAERAQALLARRFGTLDCEADCRRAYAFLERCGYMYSDIRSAIKSLGNIEADEY